jgi:hypothetical protein
MYVDPAPIINLSVKFGVVNPDTVCPLHNAQPVGIVTPDHMIIEPLGNMECTNAVVATAEELLVTLVVVVALNGPID